MKRVVTLAAALAVSAPLFAQNIATVNGKAISQEQVDRYVKALAAQGQTDSPQLREQIKNELVLREVYLQAAQKAGLEKLPEVKEEMAATTENILIRALFNQRMKDFTVTDASLKAEYDKVKAEQGGKEYHARHILVADEAKAKELAQRIAKGEDFAKLATEFSIDQGSAANGGDLGWSLASNYVPEFAAIITNLEPGQVTKNPVKSQFGWHVVRLEEVRDFEFPKLEEVRPQLEDLLRQQALRQFQEELRSKADIK